MSEPAAFTELNRQHQLDISPEHAQYLNQQAGKNRGFSHTDHNLVVVALWKYWPAFTSSTLSLPVSLPNSKHHRASVQRRGALSSIGVTCVETIIGFF